MSEPRHVLMIIADDWSPIAHCYGNDVVRTPAIDRVAQRGCVFDHAFCVTPSCAASRASILTGQYSHTHGQYGHCHGNHGFRTHAHIPTLPELAKPHNVSTALIGKNHTAPDEHYPFDFRDAKMDSPVHMKQMLSQFYQSVGDRSYAMFAPLYPHRYNDPSRWALDILPDEFEDQSIDPADVTVPPFLPDNEATRGDLAKYYQAIERFDHCVAGALEALEQSGRAKDSLVFILSDHGMPFPGAKASSFEGGHHCPLIMAGPNVAPGSRSSALVNWCDLLPTICDWLQIDPPAHLPGRSLLPLLDGQSHEGWDQTYYAHCFHEISNYYPYRVLRDQRYKYVQNLAYEMSTPLPSDLFRSPTWQDVLEHHRTHLGDRPVEHLLHQPAEALYDLQKDPTESVNIIAEPAHAERVASMRDQMMNMRERTGDPWLEVDRQREIAASYGSA